MSFFESKADRKKREEEEIMKQLQNEEKMAKEASERRQKALEDFTEKVKDYAKGKDIVAITVNDNVDFKQIVLDYMIKECGYICVQNDAFGTKYTTHYVFTFVKPEFANKFGVAN